MTERVQKLRSSFRELQNSIEPYRTMFFDEISVNLSLDPDCGWALKGKRVPAHKPSGRGKATTVLGVLTVLGLEGVMTIEDDVDEDVFIAYIREFISKISKPGDTLIMDNFSVHRMDSVKTAISELGVNIVYLSPYSPDMNPIEEAWSKLKSILKQLKARTVEDLNSSIVRAIDSISSWDAWGWISHCGFSA